MIDVLAGQGLLVRAGDRGSALTAAEVWFAEHGVADVLDELPDGLRAVRAWYGGPDVGFVQPGHAGAEEVWVVNVPAPLLSRLTGA